MTARKRAEDIAHTFVPNTSHNKFITALLQLLATVGQAEFERGQAEAFDRCETRLADGAKLYHETGHAGYSALINMVHAIHAMAQELPAASPGIEPNGGEPTLAMLDAGHDEIVSGRNTDFPTQRAANVYKVMRAAASPDMAFVPNEEMMLAMADDTPYFYRRSMDKSCWEVGLAENDDWRDVVPSEHKIIGEFKTPDEARKKYQWLEFVWRYKEMLAASEGGKK